MVFILARNAASRPVLMHIVTYSGDTMTWCGLDTTALGWSRYYTTQRLEIFLFLKCKHHEMLKDATNVIQLRRA